MKALELIGEIDEQRHLNTVLPQDAVPGPVRVIVLMPEAAETQVDKLTAVTDSDAVEKGWDSLMELIEQCQIHTGIGDLAHQHDHYLYGTPKREE
jgi:hypothetical protein